MTFNFRLLRLARRSLRARVTLGVVLPLVAILGLFAAVAYDRNQKAVLDNLAFLASQIGQVIEDGIQHEMLTENRAGLQHMLNTIGQNDLMRVVYLLDTDGQVVFAPKGQGVGQRLDNADPACQPCHGLPVEQRPGSVVVTLATGQRVFRSMKPIENQPACMQCHDPEQRLIGLLLTDISMTPLEAPIAAQLRETFLWGAAMILVVVVVVNGALSRFVMRRLEAVAHALARFGRGQLDVQLPAGNPDEIGQLALAFNAMSARIRQDESENQALSADLRRESAQRAQLLKRLITAQEEERHRVARDLHDELGQGLSGLAIGLGAIAQRWAGAPEDVRDQLRQAQALVSETTDRAYDLILALRPTALDDLGLAPALRAHAERALRDTGVRLLFDAEGLTRRLPPEMELALFRIYQEALTNVIRHAQAGRVRVSLATPNGSFQGEIADDGHGFDVAAARGNGAGPRGLGLAGMRERVTQFGGRLEVVSQPGAGTRVCLHAPLAEAASG
jgi:signal transduction histidine kinase